jgi:hypothetical protein
LELTRDPFSLYPTSVPSQAHLTQPRCLRRSECSHPIPEPRRARPRGRHPLVYLAFSLVFSLVALIGRFGMFYVAAGALPAVLLAAGAILIVLRPR